MSGDFKLQSLALRSISSGPQEVGLSVQVQLEGSGRQRVCR